MVQVTDLSVIPHPPTEMVSLWQNKQNGGRAHNLPDGSSESGGAAQTHLLRRLIDDATLCAEARGWARVSFC